MSSHTAAAAMPAPTTGEVTVYGIFAALWRRKAWVIVPTLLAALAAVGYVIVTPPEYLAEATIIVEPQESPFTRPQADTAQPAIDAQTVASQVQVIKSVNVAEIVIDKLKLAERAEFNPELRPAGLMSMLTAIFGSGGGEEEVRKAVLREYFDHMTAFAVNDTRVIVVQFWSRDDRLTAQATNAIAEAYLQVQRDLSARVTSEASGWLEKQIADLRERVSQAERKVELYRTENGLFTTSGNGRAENDPGTTIQSQQLAELSTQLSQARAQRSDAQARARLIREKLDAGQASEAREVSESGLIQRLQEERVRLASQVAELSTTLLPAHPRMREMNAQLANLDRQIRNEVEKIVAGLENDAAVAAAREQQIETNIEALKSNVAVANENEVQLRALEREAKAQRDLLATYLSRYREAAARSDNQIAPADARIISRATVPLEPFFPSKTGIPAIATIAAFVISAAIVMTIELAAAYSTTPAARADTVNMARREPDILSEPVTAATPATPAVPTVPEPAAGPIAAAMRRAGAMPAAGADLKSDAAPAPVDAAILITAVGDPHALFETALIHGRRLAGEGARTVLVDTSAGELLSADLLGEEPEAGYFDLISGEAGFAGVMFRDPESDLHVIAPGRAGPAAAEDDASARLVLEALGQTYDNVVVVAPPVYSATLAAIAGEIAVVRTEGVAEDMVESFAGMLAEVAAGPVAIVTPESAPVPGGFAAAL